MKTLAEAIKEAVEAKADGQINAVRASDGCNEIVAMVWDDSTEEELTKEAEKKVKKLTGCEYQWTISGFIFKAE